jgi:hypothetical protein
MVVSDTRTPAWISRCSRSNGVVQLPDAYPSSSGGCFMLHSTKRRSSSVQTVGRPRPVRSCNAPGTSSASSLVRQLYNVCRVTPSVAATSATGRPASSSSSAMARLTHWASVAFLACTSSCRRCRRFNRNVSMCTPTGKPMLPVTSKPPAGPTVKLFSGTHLDGGRMLVGFGLFERNPSTSGV